MDIVQFALACYRTPLAYQDRLSLAAPLPEDLDRLLWLANGSSDAVDAAMRLTHAKPQELRNAARFCIQQWCFARGAGYHRVLGVEPGASPEQIKEHYRLLMRLFHPDRAAGRETWTDCYATRINEAWTALSRSQDPTVQEVQPPSRQFPNGDVVGQPVEWGGEGLLPPLPVADRPGSRPKLPRRWWSALGWGGVALIALGGFYLAILLNERPRLELADPVASNPPSNLSGVPIAPASEAPSVPESAAPPTTGGGIFTELLLAPDWNALDQQERQASQQAVRAEQEGEGTGQEQSPHEQLAAEQALLERIRTERAQLQQRLQAEQSRLEQAKIEWLADERRRLEQLQTGLTRIEQAKVARVQAERKLGLARIEQAKAERIQAEQRRLEESLAGRARAARLEEARLEEQLQTDRERVARVRAEPIRLEAERAKQAKTERKRIQQEAAGREITARELNNLISRYTHAYQRGDLDGLMALFDPEVRGNGGRDRNRLRRDYAAFFNTSHQRSLNLDQVSWDRRGDTASGGARFQIQSLRTDGDGASRDRYEGNIQFEVSKRGERLLIKAVYYDIHQVE